MIGPFEMPEWTLHRYDAVIPVEEKPLKVGELFGIPILVSERVPRGEVQFQDRDGNVLGRIINVGQRDD